VADIDDANPIALGPVEKQKDMSAREGEEMVDAERLQSVGDGESTVTLVSLGHGLRTIHGATWAGPTTGTSEGDTVLTFEEFQTTSMRWW